MYKPSISTLIEIIKKAQSDIAELTTAITFYQDNNPEALTVVRCLCDSREQQRRFMLAMFNEITTHDDEMTDNEAIAVQQLRHSETPYTGPITLAR